MKTTMKRRKVAKADLPPPAVVEEPPPTVAAPAPAAVGFDVSAIMAGLQKYKNAFDSDIARQEVDMYLKQSLHQCFEDGAADRGHEPPPLMDTPESVLFNAVESGVLGTDMNSAEGQLWNTAKKDPSIKKAYEAIGRSYKAQRNFRLQWAKEEAEKLKRQRVHSHTQSITGKINGKYRTFGQIWKDEGKDAVGFQVAENVAKTCIELHMKGKLLHGRPWLKFHSQFKVVEFLVVDEEVTQADREAWGYKDVPKVVGTTAAAPQPGEPSGDNDEPPVVSTAPTEQGKKRTRKGSQTQGDDGAIDPPPRRPGNKELTKKFVELKQLRKRLSSATSDCSELVNVITSSTDDGEWFYANNTVWLAPLRKARDDIEAVKKESPFWAAFALQEKFQAYAKTHFKQSRVEVELEKLDLVSDLVKKLQTEADNLKSMHAARQPA